MRPHQRDRATVLSIVRPLRAVTDAPGARDAETLSAQRLVLRTLAERFGGEAACSALGRHLAKTAGSQVLGSDRCLPAVLAALEQSGAVTLDAVDETEVIARLTQDGAAFLHDMPSERPTIRQRRAENTFAATDSRVRPGTRG